MTRFGLKIAQLFGKGLPSFSSKSEAEAAWFSFRDQRLKRIEEISQHEPSFVPSFDPQSLKQLEKWYFQLYETKGFKKAGTTRKEFEECMAIYFGQVVVANQKDAKWIAAEYAFQNGKYELGVNNGLITIMLSRFTDHFGTPNNKRQQAIWRMYRQYGT